MPARAPSDPDVRTLAHPVPLMVDSPYKRTLYARTAILGRYGDTWFQVRSLGRSSRPRVQHQTPPFGFSFPPPGPAGPVPRLHQYYEGATTSCRPSRRTSFPSLGGTSVALVEFALRRTSAPSKPGVVHPVLHPGIAEEMTGSPKFLGNSNCPFAHVPFRPRQDDNVRPIERCHAAPGMKKAKAPTKGVSRLNRMAFGLAAGTVRSMVGFAGRITPPPRKTRFWLLVRLYQTGFPPAEFR